MGNEHPANPDNAPPLINYSSGSRADSLSVRATKAISVGAGWHTLRVVKMNWLFMVISRLSCREDGLRGCLRRELDEKKRKSLWGTFCSDLKDTRFVNNLAAGQRDSKLLNVVAWHSVELFTNCQICGLQTADFPFRIWICCNCICCGCRLKVARILLDWPQSFAHNFMYKTKTLVYLNGLRYTG